MLSFSECNLLIYIYVYMNCQNNGCPSRKPSKVSRKKNVQIHPREKGLRTVVTYPSMWKLWTTFCLLSGPRTDHERCMHACVRVGCAGGEWWKALCRTAGENVQSKYLRARRKQEPARLPWGQGTVQGTRKLWGLESARRAGNTVAMDSVALEGSGERS